MNFISFAFYYSLFHICTWFSLHEQPLPIVNSYFLQFSYNSLHLGYWMLEIFSAVLGLLGRGDK